MTKGSTEWYAEMAKELKAHARYFRRERMMRTWKGRWDLFQEEVMEQTILFGYCDTRLLMKKYRLDEEPKQSLLNRILAISKEFDRTKIIDGNIRYPFFLKPMDPNIKFEELYPPKEEIFKQRGPILISNPIGTNFMKDDLI